MLYALLGFLLGIFFAAAYPTPSARIRTGLILLGRRIKATFTSTPKE